VNKSPKQHRDWLVNLRREGLTPTTFTILCSVNFEDNCFDITGNTRWLHANAVPTKFDFPPHLQKSKPNRKLPVTVTSTRIRGSECGPSSEGHPLITIILDHPYDIRKSPSKWKRQLDNVLVVVANYRTKFKVSQRKTSRLKRKVNSLYSVIASFKEKHLESSVCVDVLETTFAGAPCDLMKIIVSQKANNILGAYTAELFDLGLPHPSTIRN